MAALALDPVVLSPAELRQRRQALERRLTAGWRRIDEAIAAGRDVREWEEHWLALLTEYERVCDELGQLA